MEHSKQSWASVEGQTQAVCSRNITGEEEKAETIDEICQICRGFSHQTIDCWHQKKNRKHRPKAWTTEQAAIEEGSEEDVDEEGGEEDVDEEGGEEDADKGKEEGTEGTAY